MVGARLPVCVIRDGVASGMIMSLIQNFPRLIGQTSL